MGHQQFNGSQCPNLNLSQLSESEYDAVLTLNRYLKIVYTSAEYQTKFAIHYAMHTCESV